MVTSPGKTVTLHGPYLRKRFDDPLALVREVNGLLLAHELGVRVPRVVNSGNSVLWMSYLSNSQTAFDCVDNPDHRYCIQSGLASLLANQAMQFAQKVSESTVLGARQAIVSRVFLYYSSIVERSEFSSNRTHQLLHSSMWEFIQFLLVVPTEAFTLVHQDLHYGNILMLPGDQGGFAIIDYERSLIGLPEMELQPSIFWDDQYSLDAVYMRHLLEHLLPFGYSRSIERVCSIYYCLEQMYQALQMKDSNKARRILARFIQLQR